MQPLYLFVQGMRPLKTNAPTAISFSVADQIAIAGDSGADRATVRRAIAYVIDVTARENEDTYEDRMTLAESRTDGVSLMQGMATIARTIARRVRDFNEGHRGEELENGKVH